MKMDEEDLRIHEEKIDDDSKMDDDSRDSGLYEDSQKYQAQLGGTASIFNDSKTYLSKVDQFEPLINKISDDDLYKLVDGLLLNFSKNKFVDVIESMVYLYCTHQLNFIKRFPFTDLKNVKLYYIMFKYYPYLIYSIMYHQKIDQQSKFIKELDKIDSMYNIRIEKYTTNLTKYKAYVENYYNNFDKNNICINFNNFIGINFKVTGIDYDEMIHDPENKNALIVHSGFNNSFDNVLYKSYPGIKSNFLNYEDMIKFKVFEQVKTYETDTCYEIMENNKIIYKYVKDNKDSEKLNISKDEYLIIICYDDDPKFEKCHFTISQVTYPRMYIDVLINGGLIYPLPPAIYKLYLSKMFYTRKNMLKEIEDNADAINTATQELKTKIAKLIKPCYSPNCDKCIDKWAKEFPNDKYFKIYLQGLKSFRDIQTGELDFEKYYEHIKLYFFPVILY